MTDDGMLQLLLSGAEAPSLEHIVLDGDLDALGSTAKALLDLWWERRYPTPAPDRPNAARLRGLARKSLVLRRLTWQASMRVSAALHEVGVRALVVGADPPASPSSSDRPSNLAPIPFVWIDPDAPRSTLQRVLFHAPAIGLLGAPDAAIPGAVAVEMASATVWIRARPTPWHALLCQRREARRVRFEGAWRRRDGPYAHRADTLYLTLLASLFPALPGAPEAVRAILYAHEALRASPLTTTETSALRTSIEADLSVAVFEQHRRWLSAFATATRGSKAFGMAALDTFARLPGSGPDAMALDAILTTLDAAERGLDDPAILRSAYRHHLLAGVPPRAARRKAGMTYASSRVVTLARTPGHTLHHARRASSWRNALRAFRAIVRPLP